MADEIIDDQLLRKYYMHTFNTESGRVVLQDLANRCFKNSTTCLGAEQFNSINEGKRQVLLHIEGMMSPEGINKPAEGSEEGRE